MQMSRYISPFVYNTVSTICIFRELLESCCQTAHETA